MWKQTKANCTTPEHDVTSHGTSCRRSGPHSSSIMGIFNITASPCGEEKDTHDAVDNSQTQCCEHADKCTAQTGIASSSSWNASRNISGTNLRTESGNFSAPNGPHARTAARWVIGSAGR